MSEPSILSGKQTWICLIQDNELDLNDAYMENLHRRRRLLFRSISDQTQKSTKAFITQGCVVEGEVKHSVLFTGCKVGEGAKIIDSVLMPGVEVAAGAVVQRALVADNIKIGPGSCCRQCRQRKHRTRVQTCKGGRIIWQEHLELSHLPEPISK